jgi:hypothetical protein
MPKRQRQPIVPGSYQDTLATGQKQQAIAAALAGQAFNPPQRQQGRIVAQTGMADGLNTLAAALASRRIGKKADATLGTAEDQKRQMQAAALNGMNTPPNLVQTPQAQNPYARAQQGVDAGIDPNITQEYLRTQRPGDGGKSQFGVVDPSGFTPESLQKFASTKNYGDLVPVNKMFGRYNPRDYTPESWAQFQGTGDAAVLERFAERKFQDTPGGGIIALDPISGTQAGAPVITPEQGTAQAATRKGAEAVAAAEGTESVIPVERRLDAQAKQPRIEAATRRLDRVAAASEALGTGGGKYEGRLRSMIGTPAAQELEAANAQLIGELTALTRVPGVGSQSDLEQRLAQLALPDVTQEPEVRAKTVQELHAFIADLDAALQRVGGAPQGAGASGEWGGGAPPMPTSSGTTVSWDSL